MKSTVETKTRVCSVFTPVKPLQKWNNESVVRKDSSLSDSGRNRLLPKVTLPSLVDSAEKLLRASGCNGRYLKEMGFGFKESER